MATACETLAQLKAYKLSYLTGGVAKSIRFRSDNQSEREIESHRLNITELNTMIVEYEGLCAIEMGGSSIVSRRCIIAG